MSSYVDRLLPSENAHEWTNRLTRIFTKGVLCYANVTVAIIRTLIWITYCFKNFCLKRWDSNPWLKSWIQWWIYSQTKHKDWTLDPFYQPWKLCWKTPSRNLMLLLWVSTNQCLLITYHLNYGIGIDWRLSDNTNNKAITRTNGH